jgi:hypothetical protein
VFKLRQVIVFHHQDQIGNCHVAFSQSPGSVGCKVQAGFPEDLHGSLGRRSSGDAEGSGGIHKQVADTGLGRSMPGVFRRHRAATDIAAADEQNSHRL